MYEETANTNLVALRSTIMSNKSTFDWLFTGYFCDTSKTISTFFKMGVLGGSLGSPRFYGGLTFLDRVLWTAKDSSGLTMNKWVIAVTSLKLSCLIP